MGFKPRSYRSEDVQPATPQLAGGEIDALLETFDFSMRGKEPRFVMPLRDVFALFAQRIHGEMRISNVDFNNLRQEFELEEMILPRMMDFLTGGKMGGITGEVSTKEETIIRLRRLLSAGRVFSEGATASEMKLVAENFKGFNERISAELRTLIPAYDDSTSVLTAAARDYTISALMAALLLEYTAMQLQQQAGLIDCVRFTASEGKRSKGRSDPDDARANLVISVLHNNGWKRTAIADALKEVLPGFVERHRKTVVDDLTEPGSEKDIDSEEHIDSEANRRLRENVVKGRLKAIRKRGANAQK